MSCRVADISKLLWGVQLVHSILMAAIGLIVSLVSIQYILSRPISFLFRSIVSCCFVGVSKFVWGMQAINSTFIAAIVLIVSLLPIATGVSRPILFYLFP